MLGKIVEVLSGYAFDSSLFNSDEEGIPLIRIRDVGKEKSQTYFSGNYSEDFLIGNGDLLIGMDGDFRIAEWKGGKALLNQRVCKIIPDENKVDRKYLLFALPKKLKEIEDKTSFATVKHLSVKKIKSIQIPLPPLAEQKRIAAILDAADLHRQKTNQLITKYNDLSQSLFLDIFGDPRLNFHSFEVTTINDVANKVTDGDHATPKREESGIKLLSCRNVRNGYLDFEVGVDYVGQAEYERMSKRCNPEKGDILISCSGTIGRTTAIKTDEPFVLVRSAALIKPKKELINSAYFEYYLRSKYMQDEMLKNANTSSQANLFTGPIKRLPVQLPPLDFQNKFAVQVQAVEKQKAQAEASLQRAEDLFQSLLQKAFKGEL